MIGTAAALPVFAKFLEFFSPTRSPYYIVVFFSCAAIVAMLEFGSKYGNEFHALVPAFAALVFCAAFSFAIRPKFEEEERFRSQVNLGRSIGASTPIVTATVAAMLVDPLPGDPSVPFFDHAFAFLYWSSITQLVVVGVFALTRLRLDAESRGPNIVQVALIMSSCLFVLAYVALKHPEKLRVGEAGEIERLDEWLVAAGCVYAVWAACVLWLVSRFLFRGGRVASAPS